MPTMLGHELIGALARALAQQPEPLPPPGGLVWSSADATLRVAAGLRAVQEALPLAQRAEQLEAAATLPPTLARQVAEAALAGVTPQPDAARAEAVLDIAASFPAILAQHIGRMVQHAGRRQAADVLPLAESHPVSERETFYAGLLPKRRPRYRAGEPVPARDGWVFDTLIGFGGFGEVWRVRERSGRVEAMKFCVDAVAARLVEREAETLQTLRERLPRHPNLVAVTAVNSWEPPYWLAFEYLAGGTLESRIAAGGGPPSWVEALRLFDAIVQGVAAAHQAGIVHRDIKPANVLLAANGTPKVGDFGLGKVLASAVSGPVQLSAGLSPTLTATGFGTVGYVSPEQQEGQPADPADDVFALGVLLFHLLLGSTAAQPRYIREKLLALPQPPPPSLADVIAACIDQPRGKRPANGQALRAMLQPFLAGVPTVPTRPAPAAAAVAAAGPVSPPPLARTAADTSTRSETYADAKPWPSRCCGGRRRAGMDSPGAEQLRRPAARGGWVVRLMLLLMFGAVVAGFVWQDDVRGWLGEAVGDDPAAPTAEATTWQQLSSQAAAVLAAAQDVKPAAAPEALRNLERFLITLSDEEATSLPAELREALQAERSRLQAVVREQAGWVAEAAVAWGRIAAAHDPHGTLAELERLRELYGTIPTEAFHALRDELRRRVDTLNARLAGTSAAPAGQPDAALAHGPLAPLVETARERAAQEIGIPRRAPAVVPADGAAADDPRADSESGSASGDDAAAVAAQAEGTDAAAAATATSGDSDGDVVAWLFNTVLPLVLIGLLVLVVIGVLAGGLPL